MNFRRIANYCVKVATIAVQLSAALSVKVPVYFPVVVTTIDSFAEGEDPVSFCSKVNPLPAVCLPVYLAGSPIAAKTSSFALVVVGVAPLFGDVLLPCACAV